MVNFCSPLTLNRILLCGVLTTFTMAVVTPPPAYAQIGLNDIAFWTRMEKLVEKMWKYKDKKDGNKIIDTMLEIKMEVEGYTGKKLILIKRSAKQNPILKNKELKFLKRILIK